MKIKSLLRRIFRGWFPAEPKNSNYWLKNKLKFALFLASSIIVVSAITIWVWNPLAATQMIPPPPLPELPTLESNYYPGVSVGDYVKYGNFECNFSHPTGAEWDLSVCLCAMDWQKVEVIGVSGKEVTLRYTEKLKNGSVAPHNGCVHLIDDIEHPSWVNCSYYGGYYFGSTVVAANLTEGDWIHSSGPCSMPWHQVNKTEIRKYLGVSRWVNIMKNPRSPSLTNWIFDMESGILLEWEEIGPNNERTSYNVVETNIFSSPSPSPISPSLQETTAPTILTDAFYVTSGILMIAVFVVTEVIFGKRRLKGGENDRK